MGDKEKESATYDEQKTYEERRNYYEEVSNIIK